MQPEFQAERVHHGCRGFRPESRRVSRQPCCNGRRCRPPLQRVEHVAALARRMQDVTSLGEVVELGEHDAEDGFGQSEAVAESPQQVQLAERDQLVVATLS